MTTVRVWVVALLAVMARGAAAAVPTAPAAHAAERCDGVWVVVDATELGGSVTTRCAPGDPSSGLAALEGAGHSYAFVPRVPGMVCTIDRRPDPCNGAPADAYWAYWHAEEGGSWTYATRGAGQRDPAPGTVEGWAFGAGKRPGTSPPTGAPADTGSSEGDTSSGSGSSGGSTSSGTGSGGGSGGSGSGSGSGSGGTASSDSSGSDGTADGGGSEAPADESRDGARGPEDETTSTPDAEDDEGSTSGTDDASSDVERRGTGADADDVLAGRRMGDEEAEADGSVEAEAREEADEVAIGAPSDGGNWLGTAAGITLAAALAGGAVWQVRRRNDLTP